MPIGAVRTDDPAVTDLTAPAVLFTATWFGARSLRARRAHDRAEARTGDLERQREEAERVSAEAERRRIARELHDIVAHRVTTIIIQSESGLATADEPELRAGRLRGDRRVGPRGAVRAAPIARPAA